MSPHKAFACVSASKSLMCSDWVGALLMLYCVKSMVFSAANQSGISELIAICRWCATWNTAAGLLLSFPPPPPCEHYELAMWALEVLVGRFTYFWTKLPVSHYSQTHCSQSVSHCSQILKDRELYQSWLIHGIKVNKPISQNVKRAHWIGNCVFSKLDSNYFLIYFRATSIFFPFDWPFIVFNCEWNSSRCLQYNHAI